MEQPDSSYYRFLRSISPDKHPPRTLECPASHYPGRSTSDKPVKANTRVVRTLGPNLVGVEFLNLEAKSREAIQRYVEGEVKS
jgi:hypothetical protein